MLASLVRLLATACLTFAALGQSSTATMMAARLHEFGPAENLTYEEVPRPVAGPSEVLIHVHAAGVNPVDWKIRSGRIKGFGPPLPAILGFDVSGVVESVGSNVKSLKAGDQVYSYLTLATGGGYAQYVAVPEKMVAKKPSSIDHVRAASVPLAGLTAWQALFVQADLKAGQTVLIHGAAGGVGHFAIQFAKAKGARVIATAGPDHQQFLKDLGVDTPIDYKSQKFEEIARDVDVVLDSIGGDTQERSLGCIKPGGTLVSIVEPPNQTRCQERGIKGKVFLVSQSAEQLTEIAALIDAGKVMPHVSETVPLADAAKAHRLIEQGHTQGKIVLMVP